MEWVKGTSVAMSCGIDHGHGSDLALLRLGHRLATAAPNSTRGLGTSICHRCSPKKKERERERNYRKILFDQIHSPVLYPEGLSWITNISKTAQLTTQTLNPQCWRRWGFPVQPDILLARSEAPFSICHLLKCRSLFTASEVFNF